MEINKNKLIFGIIGGILLVFIIFFAISLNSKTDDENTNNNTSNVFKVWTIGDDSSKTTELVNDFKAVYGGYKNSNIVFENFSDYEEYYYALMSAISKGEGPDVFVLNNNEKTPVFSDQVVGINPEKINPSDFRKKYKSFFSEDLIQTIEYEGEATDFLIGVPVGYETLGVFYNLTKVRSSYLENMSTLYNSAISSLKQRYPDLVPIAIGNGSTVDYSSDIITQFFMLEEGISGISDIGTKEIKQALGTYLTYGDSSGDNAYDSRFVELTNLGETGVYLFSRGEVFMLVGYPRLVDKISEAGFSKAYLQAQPFPHYFGTDGKALVNYNYFVINKDTSNSELANDLLSYLSTDNGASMYLDTYTYYLPALLSLEEDKFDDKISDDFNVVLSDFYNEEYIYSSFDKGIKNIYDKNIVSLLDNPATYLASFLKFQQGVLCKTRKIINLENLGVNCN